MSRAPRRRAAGTSRRRGRGSRRPAAGRRPRAPPRPAGTRAAGIELVAQPVRRTPAPPGRRSRGAGDAITCAYRPRRGRRTAARRRRRRRRPPGRAGAPSRRARSPPRRAGRRTPPAASACRRARASARRAPGPTASRSTSKPLHRLGVRGIPNVDPGVSCERERRQRCRDEHRAAEREEANGPRA